MTTEQINQQRHREQLAKWYAAVKIPAPVGPIVDAFVADMGTKQYGAEETAQAFCFFRDGWERAVSELGITLIIQRTVSDYTRRTPAHLRDCDILTGEIVRALVKTSPA